MGGVGIVLLPSFKCSIPDTSGLNKLNRIPLVETISGNLTLSSKDGNLKMSDLETVDCILSADGSRINVLLVYNKIFNLF